MKQIKLDSLEDCKKFANNLARHLSAGMLICMDGDLGCGKTTMSKFIGAAIGIKETINSPTFTIAKIYEGALPLYHIDAYRLEGISQDIGLGEMMQNDGVCIIEWSKFIKDELPSNYIHIDFKYVDENKRLICVEAVGNLYQEIVEAL